MSDRTIILHYHLFKNAGTSFDGILKRNFPGKWVAQEFTGGDNSAAVKDWIKANPDAVAFSSHTATGPVPNIPGVRVISALFLRDPVARIRSAYAFERRQAVTRADDRMGVALAAKSTFAGYVRGRLDVPGDRQCRNFHCVRLAGFVQRIAPELQRATEALNVLSFVGEVERFGASLQRFATLVSPVWPGFDPGLVHLNRSGPDDDIQVDPLLDRLLAENNALDYEILRRARATVWAA